MASIPRDVEDTWLRVSHTANHLVPEVYYLCIKYASGKVEDTRITKEGFTAFKDAGMEVKSPVNKLQKVLDSISQK